MSGNELDLNPNVLRDSFPPQVVILDAGAQYVDLIKKASERQDSLLLYFR